ncbi:hypothetical protein [Croceivirga radicis]|uniref:hypothetical protein n=1 Tax=Croceivirga radicis TaxID=1929488 RepID=UPI000255AFE2|nr:hypothetical protein [Croceivirga radicis]
MKNLAIPLVATTTLLLITVTLMASMNLPFNWIFYLTVLGQAFVIVMVYVVLKDDYQTPHTFKDGYEDKPMNQKL